MSLVHRMNSFLNPIDATNQPIHSTLDATFLAQHYDTIAFVIVNSIEAATSNLVAHNIATATASAAAAAVAAPRSTKPTCNMDQDTSAIASENSALLESSSVQCSTRMHTSAAETSDDNSNEQRRCLSFQIVDMPKAKTSDKSKSLDYLKPIQIGCNDAPSSDFSDTDLSEKPEKVFNESGVDESSRDERDEASEIENFDLSSCGEDSLEAMYYMLRKNEIIMDKTRPSPSKCGDDEKIPAFPEKATENLANVFREVSGKKAACALDSMNSSVDDVVLKQISSDSDGIRMHAMTNSQTEQSDAMLCTQCSATDTTDDDDGSGDNANINSIQSDDKNDKDEATDADERPHLFTASISDADSDYMPPSRGDRPRLIKDNFNVSTAFSHLSPSESTDETESLFESAATKIQASARGYLTRCRLKKTNTSADVYGSLTEDNSLDNYAVLHESISEAGNERQTDECEGFDVNVLGITDIKCNHRKMASNEAAHIVIDDNSMDDATLSMDNNESSTDTAQRRLTLHRGDAMQRNSTPESEQKGVQKTNDSIDVNESVTGHSKTNGKHNY